MKIQRCLLFVVLFFFPILCFADDLELSIAVTRGSSYLKPPNRTIIIQEQPIPFSVMLTNHSKSSKQIYWEPESKSTKSLSFEMTDENGKNFIIRRKKNIPKSKAIVSTRIGPGETLTKTLILDPDDWENLVLIEPGKVKKYRARAVYDNGGHRVDSDYYTLILDGSR